MESQRLGRRRLNSVLGALLATVTCATASCSKSPTSPQGPDPVSPLTIACPPDVTALADTAAGAPLFFASPVVTGGTAPITTTCSVNSGAILPIGSTTVACTARDNLSRGAVCQFVAMVKPKFALDLNRVLLLGDSITDGEIAPPQILAQDALNAYPEVLRTLILKTYPSQSLTWVVRGSYGQTAVEGTAALAAVLKTDRFDTLLLLEGVNDLNTGDASRIADVIDALSDDIALARAAGVKNIFLSTLLPETACPTFSTSGCRSDAIGLIPLANSRIRALAAGASVTLVDNYAALSTAPTTYIGDDGLHPTVAGHKKIAETFFAAIEQVLRVATTATPASY